MRCECVAVQGAIGDESAMVFGKMKADQSTSSVRPIKAEKTPRPGGAGAEAVPSKREMKKAKREEERDPQVTMCKQKTF